MKQTEKGLPQIDDLTQLVDEYLFDLADLTQKEQWIAHYGMVLLLFGFACLFTLFLSFRVVLVTIKLPFRLARKTWKRLFSGDV